MRHVVGSRVPVKKLTEPLPTKDGAVLRTIGEAANYILALPHEQAE
jgi:hypothetical protein